MSIYASGATLLSSGSPGVTWTPVFGDRSTWDTSGSPGYHARDIYDGYPTYHLPDNAEVGQAPIWDGYKYVPGFVETSGSGGHGIHQHVEADILDLLHNAIKLRGVDISTDVPVDGDFLRYDAGLDEWVPTQMSSGSGGDRVFGISISGELSNEVVPTRVIVPWSGTINNIVASLGIAGEADGSDVVVDIYKNGVSIFTNPDKLTITEGTLDQLTCVPDTTSFAEGDVFTFEVIESGTIKVASNLMIQIRASII